MDRQGSYDLRVALVVKSAFDAVILPEFGRRSQALPTITWAPTTVIIRDIQDGARPDGVIITDPALNGLAAEALVSREHVVPLVESRIAIGVRAGEPHPDLSTIECLKAVLLGSRAVAYSTGGQSGLHFAPLLETLGIAGKVNARAVRIPQGFSGEKLISGEADLAVQQVSELLAVPGVEIAGLLPEGAQKASFFAGAPLVGTAHGDDIRAFLDFLREPISREAFTRFGLTPR